MMVRGKARYVGAGEEERERATQNEWHKLEDYGHAYVPNVYCLYASEKSTLVPFNTPCHLHIRSD